jgi:hypothetical protein
VDVRDRAGLPGDLLPLEGAGGNSVNGPEFAPMYERIARTGPTPLATNAPSPALNVSSPRVTTVDCSGFGPLLRRWVVL